MTAPYDVAVIGAGPAGSACAYHLARRGVRVLLLDRARFPRDKACGDMVSQFGLTHLKRLGLEALVEAHQPAPVWPAHFGAPSGWTMQHRVKTANLWATIPRKILDAALVERAQQSGAELREGVTISGWQICPNGVELHPVGQGATLQARLIIVAVGSSGALVSTRAELVAVRGYFTRQAGEADLVLNFESGLMPGYLWRFAMRDDCTNAGLYITRACAQHLDLRQKFLSSTVVAGRAQIGPLRGGLVNTSFGRSNVAHGERVLYVGDAAGLVQPHLGEGIAPALESGEIAAAVAETALIRDRLTIPDLAIYTHRLHAAFGRPLAFSRFIYFTMRHPRLFEVIARPAALLHSEIFRLLTPPI